jgi:serine phosphatase RsbU (regulator of sigma subunit)
MSKPCILIVDDDRTARVLLERILKRDGFGTIVCGDGREALQVIVHDRPDLIVSDYDMPEFTGAQLCELIRQSDEPELANLPFILLTAHGGEEHEVESLESGANDFVAKPVNPAILKARIETHLRLHALRRELEVWRQNHEADLEAARTTQRAILPGRPAKAAGWDTAAHYQPVIQVGGDMYDWIRLADGRWLFWVSDATGHGASAALLTSLTKLIFRHAASEQTGAGDILRAVNEEFFSVFRGKSFMTAACVVVQPNSGTLVFAGAGHPPLLIVRHSEDAPMALPSQAPPLGIVAGLGVSETTAELQPGEIALLYSDGLYAALDADGRHGVPQDLGAVLPRDAATAGEFVARTIAAVTGDRAVSDDIAVIALRRE